ncbi:MAG: putative transporter, peremase protein [Clostridiales bacterium]|jgi:hypothetical protein|nr:putative transporter, peremase protein [Clostridiales bacterium]
MFGKLVKLEFKETAKTMLLAYIFLAILGLLAYGLSFTNISAATGILVFLFVFSAVVIGIVTGLLMALRFNKTMFSSQGYLTHTLPVTPTQLYLSKILVAFFWNVVSFFAAVLSVFAVLKISGAWDEFILEIMDEIGMTPPTGLIILFVCAILVSLFTFLVSTFFACTICNTSRFQGLGSAGPIVIYLLTSTILQIISVIGTVFIPLTLFVNEKLKIESFSISFPYKISDILNESITTKAPIGIGGVILIYAMYILIFVFTLKLLKKKVCIK